MWDLKCLGEDVPFKGIQKPGNRYYLCLSCSFQDLCCVLQSVQTKPVWMRVSSADFDVKTWCLHTQVKHTSKHERFLAYLSVSLRVCVHVCVRVRILKDTHLPRWGGRELLCLKRFKGCCSVRWVYRVSSAVDHIHRTRTQPLLPTSTQLLLGLS